MTAASSKRLAIIITSFIIAISVLAIQLIQPVGLFHKHDGALSKERSLMFGSNTVDTDYDFSVLIVSYHKTGHDLQMDLVDLITNEFSGIGPKLTKYGNKSPLRRRRHPPKIPCARFKLETGTISVQHAPDLFCAPEELARILLEGGDGHSGVWGLDRGVKIVHLVRNPFSMAVSNYHYHAQVPTPEPWVKKQHPCDIQYADNIQYTYADMILPTLSKIRYKSMDINFQDQMVTRSEFDNIRNDCMSLYQTKEELKHKNFFDHLMNYDAPEGLRLATAEMMIQGCHNGGDILRMANNIVKFKQTQIKAADMMEYQTQNKNKQLQVYTMSLDDFITRPAVSALKFIDFVMDNTSVSRDHKEAVAVQYERHFYEKIEKKNNHITHGKSGNSEELLQYLRHDGVFGKPMGKIEKLVENVLTESRGGGVGDGIL